MNKGKSDGDCLYFNPVYMALNACFEGVHLLTYK